MGEGDPETNRRPTENRPVNGIAKASSRTLSADIVGWTLH